MNKPKKNSDFSFTYIGLGLVIGFFLGSGIVYWYTNRQNDSVFSQNLWNYFSRLFDDVQEPETYRETETYYPSPDRGQTELALLDSAGNQLSLLAGDTLAWQGDSLQKDSVPGPEALEILSGEMDEELTGEDQASDEDPLDVYSEDIHLAQDSLLGIRAYIIPNRKTEPDRGPALRQLDSLLGNSQRQDRQGNTIIVEFWLSPLNYQGYKMSHNKIIIYGLDQLESFSLHSDGNSYFIKYHEDYYPLSLAMEFKPLVPSNDPGFLE